MQDNKNNSFVILSGGKSSRMGKDKADLVADGKTFLEWQLDKGKELGIEDIILSGYHGQKEYPDCRIVYDRLKARGPLGGMEASFRKAKHEWCLILPVDVILLPVSHLQELIDRTACTSKDAVILRHKGKEEPLIGMYKTSLADQMEQSIREGKGSVFRFLNQIGYDTCDSDRDDGFFFNFNTPEDLENGLKRKNLLKKCDKVV